MQDRTKKLIEKFCNNPSFDDIPSIIIGLQEEDRVCERLECPNCFKWLRNICAHEPATVVNQLQSKDNQNCATLAFKYSKCSTFDPESKQGFTMQLYQFTAWMFYMYKITKQTEYVMFWLKFCNLVCPDLRYSDKNESIKLNIQNYDDYRKWFSDFESKLVKYSKRVRYYNKNDYYLNKIYVSDKRLFLKMVIPDMMLVVSLFINGTISPFDEDNIDGYLTLFREREANNGNC